MTLPTKPGSAQEGATPLTFRVEGMDCASCAGTIKTALSRLPGISDLTVSVARETMTLKLDGSSTPIGKVEATVRKLGFKPSLLTKPAAGPANPAHNSAAAGHGHQHGPGCSHDHAHTETAHVHGPDCNHDHSHHDHQHGEARQHGPGCSHDHDHADADHHAPHQHGPGCDHDHGHAETAHAHGPGCKHDHGHHDHDHAEAHQHGPGCGHDHGHAANPTSKANASADALTFRVEGMDCASCAGTIRTALERLPGVSGLNVSVARETMTLALDSGQTPVRTIEETVRKLGFTPSLLNRQDGAKAPAPSGHGHDHGSLSQQGGHTAAVPAARKAKAASDTPKWWQGAKVQHSALGAVLIGLSFIAEHFMPGMGRYAFGATTLLILAPIAKRAVMAARFGAPFTIQMLLTLAAIGALFIGEEEEAAIVVLFFSIGEVLEGLAAAKARAGIKALGSLIPKTAMIEENGQLREVPAESLMIGQTVVTRPGDRIPADGVVIAGMSSVDESPMTGESVPVSKEEGSRVFAGSINHDASLRIRVDRSPEDNTIARIITLVEEAQDARAPTERFIDTFSKYYMPAIVATAALVAIVPPLAGWGGWDMWVYRGLALLLIGCPCALVISVPAAIASSLSSAARQGILVKGGAVIETLAKTKTVAFDKTGTLTLGKPVVTDVIATQGNARDLIALSAAIERESSHPLATAICNYANVQGAETLPAEAVRVAPGRGMEGRVAGKRVFIGAPRFASAAGTVPADLSSRIAELEAEGKTIAVVMVDGKADGAIAMRDEPREDAIAGVVALKELGIDAMMLTGDNARTASAIAKQLGVNARAEMLPETKVEAIRSLAERQTVIMVGDGINDAPALAAASVGVAIGSGTDVAMEAADAALMRNNIRDVAAMVRLARATMRNIWQNVAIALGLKVIFLVTTVTGISGLWIAVFADTGATVLVTLNAMRLLSYRHSQRAAAAPR